MENRKLTEHFEIMLLIKEIYSAMNAHISADMKKSGLTPQQIMVVKIIAHNNEVTISQLCEELSLAKATVSGIVKRLEEAGYVEKLKKDEDQRNTFVVFSEKGRLFVKTFRKDMNKSFENVFEGLSKEEMVKIKTSLQLLAERSKTSLN